MSIQTTCSGGHGYQKHRAAVVKWVKPGKLGDQPNKCSTRRAEAISMVESTQSAINNQSKAHNTYLNLACSQSALNIRKATPKSMPMCGSSGTAIAARPRGESSAAAPQRFNTPGTTPGVPSIIACERSGNHVLAGCFRGIHTGIMRRMGSFDV